jgi:lysophospholipase L1-like esterase
VLASFHREILRCAQNDNDWKWLWCRVVALAVAVLLAAGGLKAQGPRWFSAWTVSHNVRETSPALSDSTVRMIVRPTIAGNAVRIKLENTLGQSPVAFSEAYIGVLDWGAAVLPGTNRKLSFNGGSNLTLAPGAGAWSDALAFEIKMFQRLVVSLHVASASDISTHTLGLATNYYASGNHAADASGSGFAPVPAMAGGTTVPAFPFYWLAAVDVASPTAAGTIVAFGDSITDGRCSTTENDVVLPDRYQRWTDVLAARLASLPANEARAIANEAIAGNRIVSGGNGPPGLQRIDRDVFERAGATHVILFEGTNDINGGATAAQVIAGMQQIIDRVHGKGLSIIGATIIPRGRPETLPGWTPEREAHRLAVNTWIRTQAKFDGIIDFDRLMTGGPVYAGSQSIKPEFDCDYTHPNAAGYKAMGEFVDLALFKTARGATSSER